MDTWFTAPHGETFRSKVAVRAGGWRVGRLLVAGRAGGRGGRVAATAMVTWQAAAASATRISHPLDELLLLMMTLHCLSPGL